LSPRDLSELRRGTMHDNDRNTGIIGAFRANSGKVGGSLEGATLVLLHTEV
jgi:hypothetical protein